MNESAKRFNEAMNENREDKELDDAFEGFMKSSIALAKEIARKDISAVTECEHKFMLEVTKIMILGLIRK
jgi:hypothetical protein